MFVKMGAALGMVMMGAGMVGWVSTTPDPVSLLPTSQLWVEGKSTVRNWKCAAGTLQATIDAAGQDPFQLVLAGEKAVRTVELTLPVTKMDCGNETMNGHMLKALKATANPTINFKLDAYELSTLDTLRAGTLTGTLAIGGTTKPVVLQVQFATTAKGELRVTGTHKLVMTQFGMKPPSLMLGTMKVKDEVTVGFDLLLSR